MGSCGRTRRRSISIKLFSDGAYPPIRTRWAPGETRTCTFVFIGRDLDKEALVAGFQSCKAPPHRDKRAPCACTLLC